jgi:hypothetical protein
MNNENAKSPRKFKFNIVDAIIILLIICVVIFAVKFFSDRGSGGPMALDTFSISFYGEEVADFVIDQTRLGDSVLDSEEENYLGTVVEIKTEPSQTYVEDAEGKLVLGPKENYSSLFLSTEVEGTQSEYGLIINGVLYGVGHSLVLHAGQGKYFLRVFSIEKLS